MIAIDAMGGDNAPRAVVEGSLRAAKQGIPLLLCGDEQQIVHILDVFDANWRSLPIKIEHCSQAIGMDEEPSRAVINKSDASLVRATKAVAQGRADAVLSAGNSGALLVASTLIIGRVSGVLRPAVGCFLPTRNGSIFCLDMGANVDCKVPFLQQFALMGDVYVRMIKGIAAPRVALLSNGHEAYKGSSLIKQAFARLLEMPLNFVGNLESRDMFDEHADVLICDGFTGNVLLKSLQGTARLLLNWLDDESKKSWWCALLLWLNRSVFRRLKERTDYATHGGALLLGVQEPVILAHGRSHARAIENAILYAHHMVKQKIVRSFNHQLRQKIEAYNDVMKISLEQSSTSYEQQLL